MTPGQPPTSGRGANLTIPLDRSNLFDRERLAATFGAGPGGVLTNDVVGKWHRDLLEELVAIVSAQWAMDRPGPVQGFFLSGPPGVGKTTLAKRLAYGLIERADQAGDPTDVHLGIVDGAEIARAKYGESELRLRDILVGAQAALDIAGSRIVLLFDDVDALLMARGSQHAKEWHFSQDSVFFHQVDELDTRRVVLVLTTNRLDLVDAAVRDRFLQYEVGYPTAEALREAALQLARNRQLPEATQARLARRIDVLSGSEGLRTFRDARRLVMQEEITDVLGRPSRALGQLLADGEG